jgi:hypothetical protein
VADAAGVTVGVEDVEAVGEVEGGGDVGADVDGGGEVGGAVVGGGDDGAVEDGGVEDGADEDGGAVGVIEAGVELTIAVGAMGMGVVVGAMLAGAGDDAVAEADGRWLAAGEVGPPVAGCAAGAAGATWAAGLDRGGADTCPVAAVKANVTAETATRPPMPNASTSGHHRRRRGGPPSPGGRPAPGGG